MSLLSPEAETCDTLQCSKSSICGGKEGAALMVDIATHSGDLRSRLRACEERLYWLDCFDTQNSRQLRDEVAKQRARVADQLADLTAASRNGGLEALIPS
jgi:hypothetical protein